MEKQSIDFRKIRDFGNILADTFAFIRQEFKPLFKAIMIYAGPFILLSAIVIGYYQSDFMDMAYYIKGFQIADFFEKIFFNLALFLSTSVLSYTMIILTIYSYIKLYNEKERTGVEINEIGKLIAKNFLKVFGANILVLLIIGSGTLFCILPGIYLGTSLSLIFAILIIEDMSFGNAFSKSFSYTHFQWWWMLLLLIVIYLIVGVAAYLFTVPQIILSFVYGFKIIKNGVEGQGSMKDIVLMVTTFTTFMNSLLGCIPFIAIAFQYFSIVERKKQTN